MEKVRLVNDFYRCIVDTVYDFWAILFEKHFHQVFDLFQTLFEYMVDIFWDIKMIVSNFEHLFEYQSMIDTMS